MSAMEKVCTKCAGMGVLDQGGPSFVECDCAIIKRLSYTMPGEIRAAKVLQAHAEHPIVSKVGRSLYIGASYADMLAILKAAIFKHQGMYVKLTSDAEIRNVGVGSTSRKARGEDAKDVYNDFTDLMDQPPLVVVFLNRLGHKNRAAAGFLLEALTVRVDKRKPTWVVSDLSSPFNQASFAYSDALWGFLNVAFEHVEIPRILTFQSAASQVAPTPTGPVRREDPKLDVEYAPQQQVMAPIPGPAANPEPPPDPEPFVDDGLGALGKLGTAKAKFRRGGGR